jgi:hypothetical protein
MKKKRKIEMKRGRLKGRENRNKIANLKKTRIRIPGLY